MFLMRLLLREGKEGDGTEEEGKGRERREGGCLGLKPPNSNIWLRHCLGTGPPMG